MVETLRACSFCFGIEKEKIVCFSHRALYIMSVLELTICNNRKTLLHKYNSKTDLLNSRKYTIIGKFRICFVDK